MFGPQFYHFLHFKKFFRAWKIALLFRLRKLALMKNDKLEENLFKDSERERESSKTELRFIAISLKGLISHCLK